MLLSAIGLLPYASFLVKFVLFCDLLNAPNIFVFMYSGRELFLSDSSLFVDDAEAYDRYQREYESNATEEKVSMFPYRHVALTAWYFLNYTLHLENKPILEQLCDYKRNSKMH